MSCPSKIGLQNKFSMVLLKLFIEALFVPSFRKQIHFEMDLKLTAIL